MKAFFPGLVFTLLTTVGLTQSENKPCGEIGEIPEQFSPEQDGVWTFELKNMKSWEVTIYNRWGQEIYQVMDAPIAWDGNALTGKAAEPGTYIYILKCKDVCGEKTEKQGNVTLVR